MLQHRLQTDTHNKDFPKSLPLALLGFQDRINKAFLTFKVENTANFIDSNGQFTPEGMNIIDIVSEFCKSLGIVFYVKPPSKKLRDSMKTLSNDQVSLLRSFETGDLLGYIFNFYCQTVGKSDPYIQPFNGVKDGFVSLGSNEDRNNNDDFQDSSFGYVGLHLPEKLPKKSRARLLRSGVSLLVSSIKVNEQRIQWGMLSRALYKAYDELYIVSRTDTLTRIHNRLAFNDYFRELQTNIDTEQLTIAIFDLDKFKSVNSTWSLELGDKVLVYFAELVNIFIRVYLEAFPELSGKIRFFRLGGEEFVLKMENYQLNDGNLIDVQDFFERLRSFIAGETSISSLDGTEHTNSGVELSESEYDEWEKKRLEFNASPENKRRDLNFHNNVSPQKRAFFTTSVGIVPVTDYKEKLAIYGSPGVMHHQMQAMANVLLQTAKVNRNTVTLDNLPQEPIEYTIGDKRLPGRK